MSISIAGLIGAAIGLYLGWIDYKIVSGVLRGVAQKQRQKTGRPGLLERYETLVRGVLLAFALIGFPLVGYFAGQSIAG